VREWRAPGPIDQSEVFQDLHLTVEAGHQQ
jgi:hypothetical protein